MRRSCKDNRTCYYYYHQHLSPRRFWVLPSNKQYTIGTHITCIVAVLSDFIVFISSQLSYESNDGLTIQWNSLYYLVHHFMWILDAELRLSQIADAMRTVDGVYWIVNAWNERLLCLYQIATLLISAAKLYTTKRKTLRLSNLIIYLVQFPTYSVLKHSTFCAASSAASQIFFYNVVSAGSKLRIIIMKSRWKNVSDHW